MEKDRNILRELSFLEQFLAGVKRIGESISNLQPSALRLKYRLLYSDCRFAANALKWRVEDDINRLGSEDSEALDQGLEISENKKSFKFDQSDEIRLQEAAQVIDDVLREFEKYLGENDKITGWKFSYDRKKGPLELWPIYQEN